MRFVIDGLDNFPTRYLLNDACVREGVPWIYGGAVATGGMSMPILPPSNAGSSIARPSELVGPCLRCIFPEAPPPGSSPTCDTAGVLAPAIATVAGHQVTQAMKLIVRSTPSIDRWSHGISGPTPGLRWTSPVPLGSTARAAEEVNCPSDSESRSRPRPCAAGTRRVVPAGSSPGATRSSVLSGAEPHGEFEVVGSTLRGRIRVSRASPEIRST